MFSLLRQPFSVYEDTIRETPGRPEMLANYQALWLLPKKEMNEIMGTMDKAFRSRHTVSTDEIARVLTPGDKFGLSNQ